MHKTNKKWSLLPLASAILAATVSGQVFAEESDSESEKTKENKITVTGTRMIGGDPTSQVEIITSAEIKAKGLATAEDIIRSIPQNLSTINGATNLNIDGLLDANLGALGLGNSTANLRGLGSANTLVLVNGRRIAGAGGQEDAFANIRDIPAAAIEQVEISFDGGSAVYGSDAIAGVINIILRKDYEGVKVGLRHESSSTDADMTRLNVYWGKAWGTGNVSISASKTESDPVNTFKTGYTTRDYRDRFGGDDIWDFRGTYDARSALVALSRWGDFDQIIAPGQDGSVVDINLWSTVTSDDYISDIFPNSVGSTDDKSVTINFTQELADNFTINLEYFKTESGTRSQVGTLAGGSIMVPASNYYNPFGQDVYVQYNPRNDILAGRIPAVEQWNDRENDRYVVGLDWEVSDDFHLSYNRMKSESSGDGIQYNFSDRIGNPDNRTAADEARMAEIASFLASGDPSQAINLFGNGTADNPNIHMLMNRIGSNNNITHNQSDELIGRGKAFELPGGRMSYVIGYERRKYWWDGTSYFVDYAGEGNLPEEKLTAYYIETSMPFIGSDNATSWADSLVFTLQARRDDYEMQGAYSEFGAEEVNLIDAGFAETSMRAAFLWRPNDEWSVKLSRSESFKSPSYTDLFSLSVRPPTFSQSVYDPLAPELFVPALRSSGPNPDLKPETGVNYSTGIVYTPNWDKGLVVKLEYSEVELKDRIAQSFELGSLLDVEVYGNMPEFFVRADDGTLIESISRPINISKRTNEFLSFDISKAFSTDGGATYEIGFNQLRNLALEDQAIPGAKIASYVGKSKGIDSFKNQIRFNWNDGAWSINAFLNYLPSYTGNDFEDAFFSRPNQKIDSYTTLDATVNYNFGNGLTLLGGGRNLLDEAPPFYVASGGRPYDAKRVDLRGRVLFLELNYSYE